MGISSSKLVEVMKMSENQFLNGVDQIETGVVAKNCFSLHRYHILVTRSQNPRVYGYCAN